MRFMRVFQFLAVLMATGLAFVATSFSFVATSLSKHKQKQKELRKYTQQQWESSAAVHKVGPVGSQPKFVVLFIHGFLGFGEYGWENGWNEFVGRFVPALQGLSYIVYHPGLNQGKEYQSFAQGLDVYQVQQHMQNVIEEVDKPALTSSLGGHSIAGLPIVCVGHSNGAATLISLLSQHHSLAARIKSLVVLAPYADIREASTLAKIKSFPGGEFIAGSSMRLLYAPMYDASQPAPVEHVRRGKFPAGLPALFIYSHNDRVVPFKNCELFKAAFAGNSTYSPGLVSTLEMHSGGHNWLWQRVQLTHTEIDKEALSPDQRQHEKHIKHQSYLNMQDRSELSASLHNFIKQHVLAPPNPVRHEAGGVISRVTSFVWRYLK